MYHWQATQADFSKYRRLSEVMPQRNGMFLSRKTIQWNFVNTTTLGPWKIGPINGVVVLMRQSHIMMQHALGTVHEYL